MGSKITATITATTLLASCSSKSKDNDTDSTTTATTQSTGISSTSTATQTQQGTTENGTANLKGGADVMGAIGTALASIPGTLLIEGTALYLESRASGSPYCTEHGEPLKVELNKQKNDPLNDNDRLENDHKDYTATLFLCLATLSPKNGASVETMLGSLAQVRSVLCSFEKGFGPFEYTTDGNNLVKNGPKEMPLEPECFPNGVPGGITSVTFDSAVATSLDASTGYEKQLTFASSSLGIEYQVEFFNKDGVIGFRTIDEGNEPGIGGYAEMVLNSKTGVVLVNTVDDRNGGGGADSAYRRIIRMKVKGTLDATTLSFKDLESMQGIRFNSGMNTDQYSGATIFGDKEKGFYGQSVVFNSSFSEVFKGCTGAKQDCTSDGLILDEEGAEKFYNSREAWASRIENGMPLCDDGTDINEEPLPPSGAFGVCDQ